MNVCDLVDILKALLTPVVVILTAYIAFQQWKTNANKLKLDLYKRRFEIYQNTLYLSRALSRRSKEDVDQALRDFTISFSESKFLFDPRDEIYSILNDIHIASFKVAGFLRGGLPPQESEAYLQTINEMIQADSLVRQRIDTLEIKLQKYLSFHMSSSINSFLKI